MPDLLEDEIDLILKLVTSCKPEDRDQLIAHLAPEKRASILSLLINDMEKRATAANSAAVEAAAQLLLPDSPCPWRTFDEGFENPFHDRNVSTTVPPPDQLYRPKTRFTEGATSTVRFADEVQSSPQPQTPTKHGFRVHDHSPGFWQRKWASEDAAAKAARKIGGRLKAVKEHLAGYVSKTPSVHEDLEGPAKNDKKLKKRASMFFGQRDANSTQDGDTAAMSKLRKLKSRTSMANLFQRANDDKAKDEVNTSPVKGRLRKIKSRASMANLFKSARGIDKSASDLELDLQLARARTNATMMSKKDSTDSTDTVRVCEDVDREMVDQTVQDIVEAVGQAGLLSHGM